jgi:hypothetical protein
LNQMRKAREAELKASSAKYKAWALALDWRMDPANHWILNARSLCPDLEIMITVATR